MLKKIMKFFGILLSMLIISLFTFFFVKVQEANGDVKFATMKILEDVADKITNLEPIYVLVLGVSTDLKTELTDTIMLAGYNPKTQKAFLLSIPRDTFIGEDIDKAKPSDKINSLYSAESVDKTILAVEQIININIDYYVTIKTEMLIKIVDSIGGVEFDVPIDMKYGDKTQNLYINLKKGKQLINGEKAEQLLRFRHNDDGSSYPTEYGDNDYGRMRTQREFVEETIKQCLEIKDIETLKSIIETVFDDIETNIELPIIFSYLVYAYEFNFENLSMNQLPGKSVYKNKLWVFEKDLVETQKVLNTLLIDFNQI